MVKKETPGEKELKGKIKYIIAAIALLLLLMTILIVESIILGKVTYEKEEKRRKT